MTFDRQFKGASRKKIHELSKDGAALIHPPMINDASRPTTQNR
jgi:hypothetical protein